MKPILIVFPHPDDEAFGVSGSILQWAKTGIPVTYACLTLGEMGRNMGNPIIATRESLPHIRRKELEEACRIAGIKDLRRLGLRDKTVEFENRETLSKRIAAIIQEISPEIVVTFYPGYSVHPDHEACAAAVIHAIESLPAERRPDCQCVAFAHNTHDDLGEPDIVRDVSDVIEQKIDVIRAHRSQTSQWTDLLRDPLSDRRAGLIKERFWRYRFN